MLSMDVNVDRVVIWKLIGVLLAFLLIAATTLTEWPKKRIIWRESNDRENRAKDSKFVEILRPKNFEAADAEQEGE